MLMFIWVKNAIVLDVSMDVSMDVIQNKQSKSIKTTKRIQKGEKKKKAKLTAHLSEIVIIPASTLEHHSLAIFHIQIHNQNKQQTQNRHDVVLSRLFYVREISTQERVAKEHANKRDKYAMDAEHKASKMQSRR